MTDKVFERWDEINVTVDIPVIIAVAEDDFVKLCPGNYKIKRRNENSVSTLAREFLKQRKFTVTLKFNNIKDRWDMYHDKHFIFDFPPCENMHKFFSGLTVDKENSYKITIEKI